MIIMKIQGGLGNQMFQYAFGKQLATKHKTELVLDLTPLHHRFKHLISTFRNFDLDVFNIYPKTTLLSKVPCQFSNVSFIITELLFKLGTNLFSEKYIREKEMAFNPTVLKTSNNSTLYGYWQSPKYFQDIASDIRKEFTSFRRPMTVPAQNMLTKIKKTNSVCINFRRTDFVRIPETLNFHGVMDIIYYQLAITHIAQRVSRPHLFVFSDDMTWCKDNVDFGFSTTFVDHDYAGYKFADYLALMIACDHFIVPNSTFAWWAAWLSENPNKIVIAPKKWFRNAAISTSDLIPETWIRI